MIVAAPLASYVPLAALAGVLVVVAWNMAEAGELAHLLRAWRSGAVVLVTFSLTALHDLIVGIVSGCVLSAIFWGLDRLRARRAG
jgi:SulP family sulfate permease